MIRSVKLCYFISLSSCLLHFQQNASAEIIAMQIQGLKPTQNGSTATCRESPTRASLRESPTKISSVKSVFASLDVERSPLFIVKATEIVSPRDHASGLPTGKRQHGSYIFDTEVVSPRDAASGLPTGKRQHGYIKITKEWGACTKALIQELTGDPAPGIDVKISVFADNGKDLISSVTLQQAKILETGQAIGENQNSQWMVFESDSFIENP